jgi:hypothetical protein
MPTFQSGRPVTERYDAIVDGLARLGDIRSLPLPAMHLVMTLRLCGLIEQAGRDPVSELATRFQSVTAAQAALDLAETISRCWPSRYCAARPCSLGMTPDEATLAAMVRATLDRDREAFDQTLNGFVRTNRHATLFDATVHAVALLLQRPRSSS